MSSTGPLSELESLRLQVAELTRTLAERDQVLQDGPAQANLLRAIVEGTAADTGVEFFRSLVKHLSQALHVRYAFVGEWREQAPDEVRILSVWSGTDFAEPFEYCLKDTPCANVIGQQLCLHESGVQQLFPEDHLLAQMEVDSYCGTPLFDKSGNPIGILVVMDDRPITRAPLFKDLLQIFATRASAELERQRVEAALQKSEALLRLTQFAMDHAQDGVLWADDSRRFTYANEAACHILGYSQEELRILSIPDITSHYDPYNFQRPLDEIKPGTAATYESVHRRKDGTEFPVEVSVAHLEHEGRRYTYGIIRNISERKRVEQERLQALHELQDIMETVPDFMFTLDTNGNMVRWNRRVEEVTGYSPEELLNMPALAFVPPEAAARTAAAIQQAFTEGYAQLEGSLLTKDHRLIPYRWTGALLKNLQGEPIGITGIGRDVTEKKRAKAALQQERQHLVEAQALAHLGSWEWDIDSGDVQGSDEQFRIFGHEPGRFAVKFDMFLASLHPDDHDHVLAAINDALLGTHPYDLEYRIVRPNGEVRSIHARGDVHRDETGHPISMAGTVLDITERKQVEEALRVSEERWHLAVQGSNDGIRDWNIQTGAAFFSPRWKAMRGFEDHEIANDVVEWKSRIHPDDLDRVLQRVDAYLAKQATEYCEEYRVQRKDGSYGWVLDRGVALWNNNGTPVRMVGSESDISERKQAQETRFHSEAQLQSILDNSPSLIFLKDRDGRYLRVNREFATAFGLTSEEIVGRTDRDIFSPEQAALFQMNDQKVLEGGRPMLFEEESSQGDDLRVAIVHKFPLRDEKGALYAIGGIATDITERKTMEAELKLSESRLLAAQRVAHIGSWELDVITNQLWWSDEAFRIFEIDPMRFGASYQAFLEIVHPEDRQLVDRCYTESLAGHTPYSLEHRLLLPDGRVKHVHERCETFYDIAGKPLRSLGTVQDITERKDAEEALRERERALARFKATLDQTHDCVFMFAPDTLRFIYCNRGAIEQVGYSEGEMFTMTPLDLTPEFTEQRFREMLQTLQDRQRDSQVFETVHRHKDGHDVPVEVSLQLVGEQGQEERFVAVVRDITERKQAESRLRRTQYAVDHATDYIFLIGDDGYFLDINESACRRLGYTKEELLTKSVMDIDPDCPPDVWKSIWDEFKRKKLLRLETKHRSKSGEIYPVEVVATYLLHEGKELDYAFVRDISERKAAEEALRSSEERFSLAVRGSNTGIWDWDLRTNKTNFSPLWKSMLGYEDHELLGEFSEWEERLHPDDRERALATVRSYLEGTTPQYELEHRLRHKDGSYRWILARGVSISDAGGKPYRMAGSHIDITEQKQIQEALAQHERQLQTVLDALPVGVWFTDSSGKPLLANPAAKQIWSGIKQVGIETAANAAGWWETIGSSSEPHRWALSHVLTKGVPSLYETLDFECLDGTKKTIRNTAVPVQDEAGIVLGAIVLNEDITALRRAQEAIKLTQFSVDHAVEAFFWIGPDAKILHVNEAACRILEYTQDELTSMTMHDIDPNFLPELWQAYWEDLKQKGSLTFESKHWSRTGRVLDTEVTVNYLQYDGREYNCAIMRDIGERKRADEALRTSEERYRSLLDNAPIGIFLNEGGRFTYVNWEMQRILQATSPEQLIGMPVLDRIAPEFHQVVQARIQQLMEKGQPAPSLDEQFVRLDGSRVDVAVTAIPTIFNGTTVMQVLVLDITERKKAEEALREKHALLSTIMDATADIIFVKDLQGRYLHMNPAGARAVGMSVEEVAGKDDDALWPADLAACCKAADQNIMTSGTAQTMEESTTVDGDRITYLTTKAPYRDAAGRMIGIIGVAHDISQMKRSEEELRRAHAFLRQVIDIDPNFVFAKDRAGRFTLVNKAVADAYGTTVENLIGKTDADFNANQKEVAFSRETDLEVLKSLQDLFLPEAVITDSTGKIRWLQTVKRPLFNEQGQAIMVLGSATDITERKRMEEALRQRERDLRAAIEERERISQDLHDGILQSLFAVGLSLETTKSMLSLKERKTSGPALQQAIDQLNRLMHEVRNFIAGLGSDLLKGTDLPTALHHMLETLTKNYPTHVRLKIEDRAAQALSAEQSLHLLLVIQEAVSNCIRHGHAQEATVSLKLLKQGVRLSVRDNGCGFDLAASKGIGHGLANMAARAQKIGGRLTVLSKTNEGTRLVLDLPKEAVLAYS